jgi:hypothetical protein
VTAQRQVGVQAVPALIAGVVGLAGVVRRIADIVGAGGVPALDELAACQREALAELAALGVGLGVSPPVTCES